MSSSMYGFIEFQLIACLTMKPGSHEAIRQLETRMWHCSSTSVIELFSQDHVTVKQWNYETMQP